MTTTTNLIEKAERRHRELTKIIEAAEQVREEYAQLQAFLVMAKQMTGLLFPEHNGSKASSGETAHSQVALPLNGGSSHALLRPNVPTISNRAEQVLRRRGPLHMKELLQEMRSAGWKGKGNDFKDAKNVTNSMLNHKQMFRNRGGNIWEVIA